MSDMSVRRREPVQTQRRTENKKSEKPESRPKAESRAPERKSNNDLGNGNTGGVDSKTQFLASQGLKERPTNAPDRSNKSERIDKLEANPDSQKLVDSVQIDINPNSPEYAETKKALNGVANDPDGQKLLQNAVDKGLKVKLGEHEGAIAYNQGDTIGLGKAAFEQGTGYLVEVLGHELTHRVSQGDGNSKQEEGLASTLGRRIRDRYEGNAPKSPQEEAADYRKGVESAKTNPAYRDLPENTDIFDSLGELGIEFDPAVRSAAGGRPSGRDIDNSETGNRAANRGGGNRAANRGGGDGGGNRTNRSNGGGGRPGNTGNSGNAGGTQGAGNTTPTQPTGDMTAEQEQFLKLINDLRAQHGLPPVTLNNLLNQTAMNYSQALDESGQFTHNLNGTSVGDRIKQGGYNMSTATENIAKGQGSVEEAFQSWVNSPGHLKNLLNPNITEIGLGMVNNVWTQVGAAQG